MRVEVKPFRLMGFIKLGKIKKNLLQKPIGKFLMEIEAIFQYMKVSVNSGTYIKNHKTLYCISPYKTGTTFLAACYDNKISRHEPMHHSTLKNIEKNFDTYFIKRLNTLDLKLECSGFLSAYVIELSENPITKDLHYICILRKPTDWITSVSNYWPTLNYMRFDYINSFFWNTKVGVELLDFHEKDETWQNETIDKLIAFYFEYLENTKKLKNVAYYDLFELEDNLNKIDTKIGEISVRSKSNKRKNTKKPFRYHNEEIDRQYSKLIEQLKND